MRLSHLLPRFSPSLFSSLPFSVKALRALQDAWGHQLLVLALKLEVADERSRGDGAYRQQSRLRAAKSVIQFRAITESDNIVE